MLKKREKKKNETPLIRSGTGVHCANLNQIIIFSLVEEKYFWFSTGFFALTFRRVLAEQEIRDEEKR